jgi:hypothetical protein
MIEKKIKKEQASHIPKEDFEGLNQGFIKLERGIINHWVFQSDQYFRIWCYLLIIAKHSHSNKPVLIGNRERNLQRGEFITSIEKIASDLQLEYNQVRKVMDKFKINNMIKKTVGKGKNIPYVAKVVNYDKWQGYYPLKDDYVTIKQQSKHNHSATYNNDNNGNNVNNVNKERGDRYLFQCSICDYMTSDSHYDLMTDCPRCKVSLQRAGVVDKQQWNNYNKVL